MTHRPRQIRPVTVAAFAALAVFWLLASAQAQAQEGGLIVVPLEAPGEEGGDAGESEFVSGERFDPERARGTRVEADMGQDERISPLRPVVASGQPRGSAIRFDGESQTLDFALFVPDPEQARELRIASLSSINVLPERSQFSVYVNDEFVGEGRLENFTEFGTAEFPLEPGVLTRGQNRVQIRLRQYHRIFCGPEAAFALWTDIDLSASGVRIDGRESEGSEEAFLMGVAVAAATGRGVEIRGADGLGEVRSDWVGAITQQLTTALGGDPIPFRFTGFWSVQDDGPVGARVTFLPGDAGKITHRIGADGAPVMVVEYEPDSPPPGDLPAFETTPPAIAAQDAPDLIATDAPVRFSEFGFRSVEVQDRYALIEQRFRLPDDYVVLTNAKADIGLDYIYADGLPDGAMLLVHVNGHNVRLLPLQGEGGTLIEQFPVRFEARHLRAGVNTLGFEVMIPGDPPDLPCPVWDRPVLAIGEDSALTVPYSPSMYLPDMHFAFRALTADGVQTRSNGGRMFSQADLITLRAAVAGSTRADRANAAAQLHLLSLDDLAALPLGGYQVSRHAIENVLLGGAPPEDDGAGGTASADLGGNLLLMPDEDGANRRSPGAFTAIFATGWDWAVGVFETGLQWLHPRSGTLLEQWLAQHRGQAIFLQLDPRHPEQIWMLRAPGSDATVLASAIVAARTVAEGPRGQVSVLDEAGRWHNWTAPDRQPVLLEAVSPGNLRHVLGNIVSAMPIRYVMVLFLLALVAALLALRLVISTREHNT
ncbi:MAG: Bacterial cellulose synthase subunit [Rhodobacteraceae bacterium HLUCCA12]|nr:MAG: Bacterial cellulose synthase subunit [Rhodobacteraceae bacterium HLUCCA12]